MYDLNLLEFNKIKEILKDYSTIKYTKEQIDELVPYSNYNRILEGINETNEALDAIVKLGYFYNIDTNIIEILKKASIGSILSEQELLDIVYLIDVLQNDLKYFDQLKKLKMDVNYLKKYLDSFNIPQNLKTNITLAIGPDGNVLDNASKELFMARRNISLYNNKLRAKYNELLVSKSSYVSEALVVMRNGRMCLPIKIEYKNSFPGIIHDISSSNTTAYIEPSSCVEISNQLESYKEEERRQIAIILKNLTLLVAAEEENLRNSYSALMSLDLIFTKAKMAKELDYNRPQIEDVQAFKIKKAKHPLINKEKVVPIDIEIGHKFSSIIITGPNTGGKTVALKTVGLLHLMVYTGLFVPCDSESKFGYFDNILADIGDEQSIEQSLSTFSSHMKKIVKIIDLANDKALILLDELGSGTDPKEGSSLAIAIIDYLNNKGSKIICTTHYSDLKKYAYDNPNICNASVEFNSKTFMPTYRLLLGIPGRSNAIEIASNLGLNPEIIQRSKEELNSNTTESASFMANLEEKMNKLNQMEEELKQKEKEYNKVLDEVNKKKIELQNKTDKIISEANLKAKEIIEKTKEESKNLIDEIKNMSEANFKEHELASLKHKIRNLNNEEEIDLDNYDFSVGDYVLIKKYEKYGTISSIKKDKYIVNVGQFAMEFTKGELRLSAKPKPKEVKQTRLSGYNPASHATLSLDLRGKRYEEVKPLMDSYLDQAILGNLESVTIIHGFGTGAIRKAVWDYLKNCSYVKSYRYGGEGEGLNGVTVVFLK